MKNIATNQIADLKNNLIALHSDESGATATEYIILLILVACFVIGIVKIFGSTLSGKFGEADDAITGLVTF